VVVPGFWDIHVHFREPGNDAAETLESGIEAAVRGGFSTVVTMPNTQPPVDTPEGVQHQIEAGRKSGQIRILPSACITHDRRGLAVANLPALAAAGAAAFTDDGSTVRDDAVMREAMQTAGRLNKPVMDHAVDPDLARGGVMHEGAVSAQLGLPGISAEAEDRMVERDIRLAEETGCALHIQHVTTAGAVRMIRDARARGVPVTGEATPHHLALTDTCLDGDDANFKMAPPLRAETDRQALLAGVADGTLQALATDHAPHRHDLKAKGFLHAPFGVVGLETAVGVTYTHLVAAGRMSLSDWVRRWTDGPAGVLGLPAPSLRVGERADIAVLDVRSEWTVRHDTFASRSNNTPFEGVHLTGRPVAMFFGGRLVWNQM
jgi:dihydroorotase